jgi:phosphatidylglycerophosphate synthase
MCERVAMGEARAERSRRRRRLLPDGLTLIRPVLGVGAGLAVALGHSALGGWLYLAAYLTDVFDGLAARALGVASEQGRQLDGWADLISMYAIGLGLAVAGARMGAWWIVALVILTAIGGELIDRWVVAAHTVAGKALGGAVRIGTFALFVVLAEPDQRLALVLAGAAIIIVTYGYEAFVTIHELRSGERPLH